MKLQETYNISVEQIEKQDGTFVDYAFIDPRKSTDSTMKIKDGIKQFGANWNAKYGVWGWYLSPDPQKRQAQKEKMIDPAIEWLNKQETTPEGQTPRTAEQMKSEFQALLADVNKAIMTPITNTEGAQPLMDEHTLKTKLSEFKNELVNAMTNEEFLAKLEPIITFRNAQGHQLSFLNALIIWIQNPKSKMAKARSTWREKYNKEVKPGAKALAINVKKYKTLAGFNKKTAKQREELAAQEYIKSLGKKSYNELTAGEKDKLSTIQKDAYYRDNTHVIVYFEFEYCYYDVEDTVQIEGRPDVVGSMKGLDDIDWTDDKSEPTELTVQIYDAMTQIIQEAGIKLSYVDDLGGAMGVSKSGTIEVLKNTNKNAGAASTLIHEFSHELLHQKFLSTAQRGGEWAKYFIGTSQGRGMVEQQAELSAYLVLRFFNIKLMQNVNYIAIWGANADKACMVFDSVAGVANDIANSIAKKLGLNNLNEDTSQASFTGLDVAELLGNQAVAVYNNSKAKMFNQVREGFNKFFNRINAQLF